MTNGEPILKVVDLRKYFFQGGFLWRRSVVKAVDSVSFEVYEGETLGIVGESGSGKTTLGKCIVRIIEPTSGRIVFRDLDLLKLRGRKLKKARRNLQIIFQNPYSSLDPRMRIGDIVSEPLRIHGVPRQEREERTRELLKAVGLPSGYENKYPHQLSGGQRQRVAIARAIALNPKLVVADEPTSALDVSIQAQVLNLLKELQREYELTYLYISHDMGTVRYMSNRVAVMYKGRIVEMGDKGDVFESAMHPYTKVLLSSVPVPNPRSRKILKLPDYLELAEADSNSPKSCCYYSRCPYRDEECGSEPPPLTRVGSSHYVACWKHG